MALELGWVDRLGRRFARATTRAVVARPALWRLFRGPLRAQFNRLAGVWEDRSGPEALVPLAAALDRVETATRVLDLGTGTGKAARAVARRYPGVRVVGVDLAPAMIEQAKALLPVELADRVTFQVADAAALPFADASFDLVVLFNMIPFFPELGRVTMSSGTVVIAFAWGPGTPIYVPPETLREHLRPFGFGGFEDLSAGQGTAMLARKQRVA